MLKMYRTYEGESKLNTEDLLTALKSTMNYEGDLYYNGKLIYSSMGLEYEDNKKLLAQYGIVPKEHPNYIRWKYADESKNVKKYFVDFLEYKNVYTGNGEDSLQLNIHDYKSNKYCIEFKTLSDVYQYVWDNYINTNKVEHEAINIVDFSNDECKSYKYFELLELALNEA